MRKRLSVLVMAAFLLFVVSACGGGGGGAQGGGEAQGGVDCGEQAEGLEQAEDSTTPAEPPKKPQFPGEYATHEFQPAFTASIGKEWAEESVYDKNDYFAIGLSAIPDYVNILTVRAVYDVTCGKDIPAPSDLTGWFQQHPYVDASDPTPVTVGGVSGEQFSVTPTEVPSKVRKDFPKAPDGGLDCSGQSEKCIPALVLAEFTFNFYPEQEYSAGNTTYPGHKYRVTVLDDVAGETVAIVEDQFNDPTLGPNDKSANEKFPSLAKGLISTVEWKDE